VLQGVDGVLVRDRLGVEATVLPDRVVVAPNRWVLRIVNRGLRMVATQVGVASHAAGRSAARPLANVQHDHDREDDEEGEYYPPTTIAPTGQCLFPRTARRVGVPRLLLKAYPPFSG
jgi:hypothetical protein